MPSNIWKLSPSGLNSFNECKGCFWLEHHHGSPGGMPWLLNMAMDSILKTRYDVYRKKGTVPPEMAATFKKLGVKLYADQEKLNEFRGSSKHLEIIDEKIGYHLKGKIDDLLVERDGTFVPTDYKASGYAPREDKKLRYILQLNAYAFMFSKHGLKPSRRGTLLHYFVEDTKNPSLDVHFTCHVDVVDIDLQAFEKTLKKMVACLNGPYPGNDPECEDCKLRVELQPYAAKGFRS